MFEFDNLGFLIFSGKNIYLYVLEFESWLLFLKRKRKIKTLNSFLITLEYNNLVLRNEFKFLWGSFVWNVVMNSNEIQMKKISLNIFFYKLSLNYIIINTFGWI